MSSNPNYISFKVRGMQVEGLLALLMQYLTEKH